MKKYIQQRFVGERALFQEKDAEISYCTFADGESPLKESSNLKIEYIVSVEVSFMVFT